MRSTALLGMVLAALVAGCALDAQESRPMQEAEPTEEEGAEFNASLFKFTVQVPDDHQGKAGGWQVTTTNLNFSDWRSAWLIPDTWSCHLTIGMPIRAEIVGVISPERAASMSAAAAVAASTKVMNERPRWSAALFCPRFADQTMRELNSARVGARVTSP